MLYEKRAIQPLSETEWPCVGMCAVSRQLVYLGEVSASGWC